MGGFRVVGSALALVMMAAVSASGQQRVSLEEAAARTPAPNPSLTAHARGIRDEINRRELVLQRFDARMRLRGALVETMLDMHFVGSAGEDLEGQLHVDLPDGAIVTGYALDVEGQMIDGSLVEAPKARASYERQVRGQIDPGLGEVDRKGGFNVRVYPIEAKKGRRIRLTFVAPAGERFELPLELASRTGEWSVAVEGLDEGASASVGSRRLPGRGGVAMIRGSGALRGGLKVRPGSADVLASRHPLTGETYWQVSGVLPGQARSPGGTMRIYWDRSRSQKGANHRAVIDRLRQAIAALAPETIELVAFNSQGVQRITVEDADELAAEVAKLSYAGASSYAPLTNDGAADNCLLVTDGRLTLEPVDWRPNCRLNVVASGEQADQAALSALAERSGGRLIEPADGAVDWRAVSVEKVIDAAGKALDFTLLPAGAGRYRLAVANPAGGPIRVILGGQEQSIAAPRSIADFPGEGTVLASRRLSLLDGTGDRAAFVALSRRYSIASPTLSFLVLEDPADYVEADVEPTATYPGLAEYRQAKAENDREKAEERTERFDELLSDWEDEVEWWERKFEPGAKPSKADDRGGDRLDNVPAHMAPPPPPPPAPPPAASPAILPEVRNEPPPPPPEPERGDSADDAVATDEMDASSIVVTGSRIEPKRDISVVSSAWRPERDYLTAFDRNPGAFERSFGEWEDKAGGVPAFYLDTADWLMRRGKREQAVETLLSALELPSADNVTIGLVAARLERWGQYDLAIQLRERQMLVESHRPQIKRLLALALAARAKSGAPTAKADLERAIGLLAEVALEPVDDPWEGIDVIALREANALIPRLKGLGGNTSLDPRLIRNLDADLRIVIDWSSDATDLDLWVDEPNGERAIYSNAQTAIGGRLSNDMTAGYGPEEYWLRRAPAGTFEVLTNRFASDRLDPNGKPRLHVRMIRDFGRPTEREEAIDLEMEAGKKEGLPIGSVQIQR